MDCPNPTMLDFVLRLRHANRKILCDADVHPIRKQVQNIIDGEDAPLEWLTLPNSSEVKTAYLELRDAVEIYRAVRRMEMGSSSDACQDIPYNIKEISYHMTVSTAGQRLLAARWTLVCKVTEGIFGDRKYRAATFWHKTKRELVAIAKANKIKHYSRMRKHQLIYALVEAGLG